MSDSNTAESSVLEIGPIPQGSRFPRWTLRAGVPDRPLPPVVEYLRHTHASLLVAQGEHPKVISERLGHSSIAVTFDVYGHLMPGLDEEVAEKLRRLDVLGHRVCSGMMCDTLFGELT